MRSAYIGPGQIDYLRGLRHIRRAIQEEHGWDFADLERLFFVSAYQGGVDRFVVSKGFESEWQDNRFLRSRVDVSSTADIDAICKPLNQMLEAYRERAKKKGDAATQYVLFNVGLFLTALFGAMATGAVPVVFGVPNQDDLERALPTDLAISLGHLFSSIKPVEVPGIIPRFEVNRDEARRLEDLIHGEMFASYTSDQSALDDSTYSLSAAVPNIHRSALSLIRQGGELLAFRNVLAGALQWTPKIIDAAAGKLPGAVAEALSKLGSEVIANRRRIMIYDFAPMMGDVLEMEMKRLASLADDDMRRNKIAVPETPLREPNQP
ncbi:hypothetical protein ACFQX4_13645 [Roseomonas sp. GCM10028921]